MIANFNYIDFVEMIVHFFKFEYFILTNGLWLKEEAVAMKSIPKSVHVSRYFVDIRFYQFYLMLFSLVLVLSKCLRLVSKGITIYQYQYWTTHRLRNHYTWFGLWFRLVYFVPAHFGRTIPSLIFTQLKIDILLSKTHNSSTVNWVLGNLFLIDAYCNSSV